MNICFDKIYIISFVKNSKKQCQIKYILENILKINNFEFVYGLDMNISNMTDIRIYDNYGDRIAIMPNNDPNSYESHHISCSIAHITALQHAYYNNFNNVLIIEDDVLLYKNLDYVNKILSYYPEDADVIQYGYIFDGGYNEKYDNYYDIGHWYAGTQCYGICNKNTMNIIINRYLDKLFACDNHQLYKDFKIYNTHIPIFLDPDHCGDFNINEYE